jgi:hypothetical protein
MRAKYAQLSCRRNNGTGTKQFSHDAAAWPMAGAEHCDAAHPTDNV